MANIEIDTTKLKETGKDIMNLTIELNETLESLYNRLDRMTTHTGEWTGLAAEEFIRKIDIEKKSYFALKDSIYLYGKLLYDSAEKMDVFVKNIKNIWVVYIIIII